MKTKELVTTSLFASLICITTAYILHIPTGINGGYIHIGDAFIYLAASILNTPSAIIASIIGAGLADLLTGATIWILPTIIIKSIMVLFISNKYDTIINIKNIIGTFVAGIIGTILYMIAEGIIFGNLLAAFTLSFIGLLQPVGSFFVYIIIGTTFDKLDIKNKLKLDRR